MNLIDLNINIHCNLQNNIRLYVLGLILDLHYDRNQFQKQMLTKCVVRVVDIFETAIQLVLLFYFLEFRNCKMGLSSGVAKVSGIVSKCNTFLNAVLVN